MGRINNVKKSNNNSTLNKTKLVSNESKTESTLSTNKMDAEPKEDANKKCSIGKIQFKTIKKSKSDKLTISKSRKTSDKDKYDALKKNVLLQIKTASNTAQGTTESNKNSTFIDKTQTFRLTNTLIKSIHKNNTRKKLTELDPSESLLPTGLMKDKIGKQIKKRDKTKLKRQVFQKKIVLLKKHIKDTKAKSKREKTVIVGDMKPMIDSLFQSNNLPAYSKAPPSNPNVAEEVNNSRETQEKKSVTIDLSVNKQNKREVRNKNIERENSKPIKKESLRIKKMNDDLSLFNELSAYSAFTSNPLEILKKTL